jgi:hypothetical protein
MVLTQSLALIEAPKSKIELSLEAVVQAEVSYGLRSW